MKLLIWFFTLFLPPTAMCQLLPFQIYTTRDGLISNSAIALLQDSKGYIWIGSYNGFSIFNGFEFKNYSSADGFPISHVGGFAESKRLPGTMWISTVGGGVYQFTNGKFEQFKVDSIEQHNQVGPVLEDHRGTLWCGTKDGLFHLKDSNYTEFAPGDSIGAVTKIVEIGDSLMWITSRNRGIFCYLWDGEQYTRINVSHISQALHNQPFLIAKDYQGNLWISDLHQRILKLAGTHILNSILLPDTTFSFQALLPDRSGNLWLGTVKGLYKIIPGTSQTQIVQYSKENGLPENLVLPGIIDAEGNLWFESFSKGLVKLTDESTISFKLTASPYVMNNASARVDRIGRFWVTTPDGLWEIWKTPEGSWRSYIHPTPDEAKYGFYNAVFIDREGYLWTKFWKGQLHRYRVHTRRDQPSRLSRVTEFEPGIHFPTGLYNCFTVDRYGRAWLGVEDQGVAILDPRRSQPLVGLLKQEDGLTDLRIRAMMENREGTLVLGGTAGRVFVVHPTARGVGSIQNYTVKDGLPTNAIHALWEDQSGTVWIGMRRGRIATLTNGIINPIPEDAFINNTAIWGFGDKNDGRLWVGTQKGLVILDKESCMISGKNTELMGSPVYSCGETEDGLVWFVSDEGFRIFNPSLVNTTSVAPPIHITKFAVGGKEIEPHAELKFPSSENNCIVEFIGISYHAERDISYEYKLEPADTTWSAPTRSRAVSFAALQPGSYRFSVRAFTGQGRMSATSASLDFTILPPWWQSWWFILLAGTGIAAIVTAMFRYRVRRLLELERLRTRIATDLHDDIGSTLSSISVLSEMLRRDISKYSPKAAKRLERIGLSARTTLEAMNDIVWTINPGNDSLENFTTRLHEYATEVLEAKNITFDMRLPEHSTLKLPMETRRNLYLLLKEAINNIVQHSKCLRATLAIHETPGQITFIVEDDGVGFNPASDISGNGLSNMRNRSNAIGGSLIVHSQKRKGTTISLVLKIT